MPLSQTPTGCRAGAVGHYCPNLPPELHYFTSPLPGAGPFVCPHPCGGYCALAARHDKAPPPPDVRDFLLALRLNETKAGLVAAALGHEKGRAGTATDPHPRPCELTMNGRRLIHRN